MGMEDIKIKRELTETEFNDHFKDDKGVRNVSKDYTNEYGALLSDPRLFYSLGPLNHYDVYIKNGFPEIYEQIMEKSDKTTIIEIDKLVDLYNLALNEKKEDDMLDILKKINVLVLSVKE
jgi:hypothetical protein